ncbi:MAG: type I restriction enzyme S subunit [Cellvibrionaceae bacterium]|jgi:type I restriction enzyme S subunit
MSNPVPYGWSKSHLGDCVGVQGGNAFRSEAFTESGIPVIRISNVKKDGSVDLTNAIYADEDETLERFKVESGDILIAMSGATTGKVGRYRSARFAYLNQRVGKFFVKNGSDISMDFIHHVTSKDDFVQAILIDAAGGAQPNISNKQIESITVLQPSLPEQQKIAAILTSVDNVIESTQAQINKLQDLKTAMMQELLTRGVCDENGKRHSEFKDSPVGQIPVGWDVAKFNDITVKIQDGTHFSPQSKDGPCLYLTSKNIQMGKLKLNNIAYISQEEHDAIYKRCDVQYGDVLLTKDGANTGNCAMNTLHQPFSLLSSVAFLRCDTTMCLNEYLYQFISSPKFQKVVSDSMTGNAITRLTLTLIKNMVIALPKIEEQTEIVKALTSVDNKMESVRVKLGALHNTKKALMQDLLTGKVRVAAPTHPCDQGSRASGTSTTD